MLDSLPPLNEAVETAKAGHVKQAIDLNSDMGESFGPWTIGDGVDEQLMPLISSANISPCQAR